jgi:hypothetical protein
MNSNPNFCPEMGNEEEVEVVQKIENPESATSTQAKSSYEGIVPPLLSTKFENKTIEMFRYVDA